MAVTGAKKSIIQAQAGSLLKVWEGTLELTKDLPIRTTLYSTMEIDAFYQLPELPSYLPLKGKAKLIDVTTHFMRLKRDRKLLRGWLTRKAQS